MVEFAQIRGEMRPVELDTDQLAAVQVQGASQQALRHCDNQKTGAAAMNNKP